MKRLTCEMCGSTDLIKQDGVFVCQHCGTKYSTEEAKKMMIEGTVDVSGSTVVVDQSKRLDNLYKLARRAKEDDNAEDGAEYYGQISVEEPNDWEAQFYRVLFKARQCKIAGIGNAAISVANSLDNVYKLINDYVPEEKKAEAYDEVGTAVLGFVALLVSNVSSNAREYDDAEYRTNFLIQHIPNIALLEATLADNMAKIGAKDEAVDTYKLAIELYSNAGLTNSSFFSSIESKIKEIEPDYQLPQSGGCYIATAVYGSYDCPEVWVLRRYRDFCLAKTARGRAFIKVYYAISPTIVKMFGNNAFIRSVWKHKLDKWVLELQNEGYENSKYQDFNW